MRYWNQDNFTGLRGVGEAYSSRDGYAGFADYCLLRERGLKRQAMTALEAFVARLGELPHPAQRKVAEDLASLAYFNQQVHQLLPHPLKSRLTGILEQWVSEGPSEPAPNRWLGFLKKDPSYFEAALRADPDDEVSLCSLALAHLEDIDYRTHHLSESKFIGDEEDASRSLAQALDCIERLPEGSAKRELLDEVAYYRNVLGAWEEYRHDGTSDDFPAWCGQRGLGFRFWSVVYYSED